MENNEYKLYHLRKIKKTYQRKYLYFKILLFFLDTVSATHLPEEKKRHLVEKNVSDAIGIALIGARDWEGGRKEREDAKNKQ